jgi:site-specific DNA-adenine methylase
MSYPGGKGGAGVFQTIINQQPPHDVYIEPFLGGGSVLLAKRPASTTIGIDADRSLVARWGDACGVELIHGCGISYLQKHWDQLTAKTLIYCDPPYVLSSRARNRSIYAHEMTDGQHRRLLAVLQGLPCMVQISGYFSPMYCKALSDWRVVRFMAATRGGMREEWLWMNYPAPAVLHDYQFLGADYRERERITRKASRWVARFASLPELERLAILSRIQHSHSGTSPAASLGATVGAP